MNNILNMVSWAEEYFDIDKMERRFNYVPCYDFVVEYCQHHDIKMRNNGGSHFDWECELNKEDVLDLMRIKYRAYYIGK